MSLIDYTPPAGGGNYGAPVGGGVATSPPTSSGGGGSSSYPPYPAPMGFRWSREDGQWELIEEAPYPVMPPGGWPTASGPGQTGTGPANTGGEQNVPVNTGNQGLFPPGWQTPIDDPGRATRNYLRSQGNLGNPFNQAYQRSIDTFAGGLSPHYANYALGGGTDPNRTMEENFSNFIGSRMSGARGGMNMGEAGAGLTNMSSLLQRVAQGMSGVQGADLSTPEGRAAAMAQLGAQGQFSPMQLGFAGQYLTPESQAAMFLSSYLPALGPALTASLRKVIAPQQQQWEDQLAQIVGGSGGQTQFMSFLDRLLGNIR